jgi:XRE family aerobic/anaerobic benzoate catabolism transcriptional regulator
VLTRLLAETPSMVLATGGSIVNHKENFGLLRESTRTVWLRAKAEDHWNRVIQQGDSRPMAQNPHAFSELKALLAAREPLYATADHVVETTARSIDDVVESVITAVGI